MLEISISNLSKTYGTDVIFEGINLGVQGGEIVGVVGRNGAGKTTLFRIIAGIEQPSGGGVKIAANSRIGYLRQDADESFEGNTVEGVMRARWEALTATGIEVYESEIVGILRSMAFTDEMLASPVDRLSGGEKTRLAFSLLLLEKPDILLLDEPTNHLDIGTLNWLEQKIRSWQGTVVVVTHDRYFLDRTVNRIVELERGKLTNYPGNYTEYIEKKRLLRESELRAWENRQAEIRRQEDMIRHMKERGTEKLAKRAASREKRLDHVVRLDRPASELRSMRLHIDEKNRSGDDVIEAKGLEKGFGHPVRRVLFSGIDFDLKRGDRLCLVGANGIGKTTLLKILLGRMNPDAGYVRKGVGVRFGYFEQEQRFMDPGRTVLEEMTLTYRSYTEGEMRNILAGFLFTGDMVFREIGALSGGERAKLALVKLLLSGVNTLVLDEPTNHLDIPSREAIEDALLEFPGTLLAVSHDRYFLNKIPTAIAELTGGGLALYPGRYDYYTEKRAAAGSGRQYLKGLQKSLQTPEHGFRVKPGMTDTRHPELVSGSTQAGSESGSEAGPHPESEAARARMEKKRAQAEQRRKEKEFEALEARIMELEEQIAATEADISSEESRSDPARLIDLTARLDLLHRALSAKNREWENWEH